MILGIDATNIRHGGGVTHLKELLHAADPMAAGFSKIILWSNQRTLDLIEDQPWLEKAHEPLLDKSLIHRIFWQRYKLTTAAKSFRCDLLFVPGGSYAGSFRPFVTMSRNLLPFEWRELRRFGFSWLSLKLIMLRFTQAQSFKSSNGLIFLNTYAFNTVLKIVKFEKEKTAIIPHGINLRFSLAPRLQLPIEDYDMNRPFRILYVSTIDMFKHQWAVAEAVANLRGKGFPIVLDLVGSSYKPALKKLNERLEKLESSSEFINYLGQVPYIELHKLYASADLGLFASTCENMPNILIELMASGLPIVCSNYGPMPEVLQDNGVYFNPENPADIENSILRMIKSPLLRYEKSELSFNSSSLYSWRKCADETFKFLGRISI